MSRPCLPRDRSVPVRAIVQQFFHQQTYFLTIVSFSLAFGDNKKRAVPPLPLSLSLKRTALLLSFLLAFIWEKVQPEISLNNVKSHSKSSSNPSTYPEKHRQTARQTQVHIYITPMATRCSFAKQ